MNMKKEQMAICDSDEKYVYRLQEILEQRSAFPFAISVFTEPENIPQNEWEEMGKKYRLILAGETFYEKMRTELKREGVTEDKLLLLKGKEGMPEIKEYIWKYQSADNIRRQIVEYYAEKENEAVTFSPGRKKGTLLGVFSPACRELQSSFSILLGQYLAKQGSVLYLNFESFSGLSKLLEETNGRDLTDLVYYMEGGRERLVCKLESMVGNLNGLDYVSPAFSFVDLAEVREENWLLLLQTLKQIGHYDYILLDLSENIQGVLNILRMCESVYTLSSREGMAQIRLAQYEELLQKLDYDDVLKNTKKCELPIFGKIPGSIEELPYSEMSAYVKGLMREEFA